MRLFSSDRKDQSDDELLIQYRKSADAALLGALYSRYVQLVYGLCLKYLKSREEAQDAVMDIFESLTEKLRVHEVQYFKSWLYMVTKNHCLMKLRKARPEENINGSFMENDLMVHPIDTQDDIDSDLNALEKCLNELRGDQQQCVRLFYLQQKSYQEIVEHTAFKIGKVKSYIQNGKRNLKICLERENVRR